MRHFPQILNDVKGQYPQLFDDVALKPPSEDESTVEVNPIQIPTEKEVWPDQELTSDENTYHEDILRRANVPPANVDEPWAITPDECDFDTSSRAIEERREYRDRQTQVGVELLAVYLPFHFYPDGVWGVRFFERPTLQFARGIWQETRIRGLPYDLVHVTKMAVYVVARHEFMHYLTELFSLQLELLQGRQFYRPYYNQVYKRTYPTTDCIEETVADYWFLDNRVVNNPVSLADIFHNIVVKSVGAYSAAANYDRISIRLLEDRLASQVNQIMVIPRMVPPIWGQLPRPYFQPWTRYENINWIMNRSCGGIVGPILNSKPLRKTIKIYHR